MGESVFINSVVNFCDLILVENLKIMFKFYGNII